jgi:hypothetical protein
MRLAERRHFDLGAERGLRDVQRDGAMQVVSFAFEELVRADLEKDVEIAWGAPIRPGWPSLLKRSRWPSSTPAGIFHFQLALHLFVSVSAALAARVADHLPAPLQVLQVRRMERKLCW